MAGERATCQANDGGAVEVGEDAAEVLFGPPPPTAMQVSGEAAPGAAEGAGGAAREVAGDEEERGGMHQAMISGAHVRRDTTRR